MLSTTDPDDAWLDFIYSRMATLREFPLAVDPSVLKSLSIPDSPFTNATPANHSAATANPSAPEVAGAVAQPASPLATSSAGDVSGSAHALNKYGPAVIGLLGANLAVLVLLSIVAVVACVRKGGAKTRSIAPSYAPVSLKDKVEDESEFSAPVHSYGG